MTGRAGCISAIYRKELSDILRDRRTLTAMIVIPVVLYPVLMLGFLRAAESEQQRLKAERFVIEVPTADQQAELRDIITLVEGLDPDPPRQRATWEVMVGDTPRDRLGDAVQLRVQLTAEPQPPPFPEHLTVEITYNEIDVHSRTAMGELSNIFHEYNGLRARGSLDEFLRSTLPPGSPTADVDLILNPVAVKTVSTATEKQRGGWALGQIIPIILVLMTITGAIYPAIDLTAGERERGTLETLMAAPVPVLYLIVGKFLVVATVAMITAVLNLGSVGATMHFGGITRQISTQMPVKFPLHVLPIILTCMVPFALLFSAILVAVCSFARTFKEAQNYVMPVIIAAMIPGFGVLLPSVELRGGLLVMPVGNMVLLTRELFQQTYTWTQVAVVLLSTTLYAAAAVAVATRLFGQEVVLFADAGSYRTLLQRRFFRPTAAPTASQALLLAALLFPAVFYVQSLIGGGDLERFDFLRTMGWVAVVQFLGLFLALPLLVAIYFRIDPGSTFRLRWPPARAWIAALCIGASSWALALEFSRLQSRVLPVSESFKKLDQLINEQVAGRPLWLILLLLSVVPAVCEEWLFRGFILSGLSAHLRKWPAILATGAIFGIYHFMIEKIPLTALLGVLLAYLAWQGRSLYPAVLAHAMHNAAGVVLGALADRFARLADFVPLERIAAGGVVHGVGQNGRVQRPALP
ncbi:MAG: CPBP family intramembrane metalloprotease, partial [Phycisphaerae bacterium]